ncbi:SPFH domain-containing protein [Anaerolineales bacterium HSG24]|nr:SPFH domain-containing protein [Anaerolineales bacterium HSG24]
MIKPAMWRKFYNKISVFFTPILLLFFVLGIVAGLPQFTPWKILLIGLLNIFLAIITSLIVLSLAGHFVDEVYGLNDFEKAKWFLMRFKFGPPEIPPIKLLKEGKVLVCPDDIINRIGGPGHVIVRNDTAVVFQKKGQLTRVGKPGFYPLEPFEKVYDIIDLRPKQWEYSVGAMTREGIPITWNIEVHYQIDDGGQEATEQVPYPCSEEAIFRATTQTWIREKGRLQDMDWEGRLIISSTEGPLRSLLSRRYLDELVGADELAVRESIQQEMEQMLRKTAPSLGAKILQVKLHNLQVHDDVTQQWIKTWQQRWHQYSKNKLMLQRVENIKTHESLKGKKNLEQIRVLGESLQSLASRRVATSIVFMRLFEAMDTMYYEHGSRIFLPEKFLEMFTKLEDLLGDKLFQGEGEPEMDEENGYGRSKNNSQFRLRIPIVRKEKPTQKDITGYIKQIGDFTFEIEGKDENHVLKAELLKGNEFTIQGDYSYFAIQVSENGMDEANIFPGDYVILQISNLVPLSPAHRDIAAIVISRNKLEKDTITLRRVMGDAQTQPAKNIILTPESSNSKLKPQALSQVKMVGIAMAVLKNLN